MNEADPLATVSSNCEIHDNLYNPLKTRCIRCAKERTKIITALHYLLKFMHLDTDDNARDVRFCDDRKTSDHNFIPLRLVPTFELSGQILAINCMHDLDWPFGDVPALRPILPLAGATDIGRYRQNWRTVMHA